MQTKSEMINRIAELAEENAKLNAIIDSYQPRLQKYKNILQEIKAIANKFINELGENYKYEKGIFRIFIQKITKAEEEWK